MPPIVTVDKGSVSSINDLCRSMPTVCQGYFTPMFIELYNMSSKYFAAKHAAEEFERMHATSKIPASLNSLKTPILQVAAEFRNGGGHHPRYSDIDNTVRKFRREMVTHFKEAKIEEAAFFYEEWIKPEILASKVKTIMTDMALRLVETHGVEDATKLPTDISKDVLSWEKGEGVAWASQVIELARLKSLAGYEKTSRKRKAKADVDIEMTGTSAGDVDAKSLEKTVARVLARQEQSRRDKKKSQGKGTSKPGLTRSNAVRANKRNASISSNKSSKKQRK